MRPRAAVIVRYKPLTATRWREIDSGLLMNDMGKPIKRIRPQVCLKRTFKDVTKLRWSRVSLSPVLVQRPLLLLKTDQRIARTNHQLYSLTFLDCLRRQHHQVKGSKTYAGTTWTMPMKRPIHQKAICIFIMNSNG